MKQRSIEAKRDNIRINTEVKEVEVFDISKLETIKEEDIKRIYSIMFAKHKDKVLSLVLSRIALDSVMTGVETSIAAVTNGAPIKIQEQATSEKIDSVFDRALLIYAFESALSETIEDATTRREFILKYVDSHPSFVTPQKDSEGKPIVGATFSRDPQKQASQVIDNLKKLIEQKTGLRDNSPSPYGDNKPSVDGKLKTAGKLVRKTSSRSKRKSG